MSIKPLNETELTEILKIAQEGEIKFREMSDYATMMAEKWRLKTPTLEKNQFDILEQSAEMEIYRNLESLAASFRVFKSNFHELVQGLEHLKDPQSSLIKYSNNDHRENLDLLNDETSRLLHNFLASAFSLIEHTRVIVKRLYDKQAFEIEYNQKLKQDVTDQPVHSFVKELRNYTQHYTLPIVGLQISFAEDAEDIDFRVKIEVKSLKKWDNWKRSKSYLDTLGDNFCIETIAKEYFVLIENFYDWLRQRQQSLHQADFIKLQQMRQGLIT